MARAKRASDERYNARRRAKRLINSIKRQMQGQSSSERAASQAYINQLQQEIQASYTPRKGSAAVRSALAAEAESHAHQLERMTKNVRAAKTPEARTNKIFERQLNAARLENPSTLGRFGKQEVDIFYAATRRIWQKHDVRQRNKFIMEYFGVDNLRAAFTKVLYENVDALQAAIRSGKPTAKVPGITSENEDFYNEVGIDPERQGSQVWDSYLKLFG